MKPDRRKSRQSFEDWLEAKIPGLSDYDEASIRTSHDAMIAKELEIELDDAEAIDSKRNAVVSLRHWLKEVDRLFEDKTVVDELIERHRTGAGE